MDLEPEAVAEAVAERPGERRFVHHSPGGGIGVDTRDPRAQCVEAGLLCGQHDGVGLLNHTVDRTGRERARVVGCVPVDLAAGVDDHRLTAPDLAVGRTAVRPGGVRARRDDRLESEALTALVMEELLDRPGHVTLGSPDESLVNETFVDAVGDLARDLDGRQLLLVLGGSQLFDEAAARDELDGTRAERLVSPVRDVVALEADPAGQASREILQERPLRLLELDALDGACGLGVTEVAEEADPILLNEESCVRALEAEQVEDVRRVGDEEWLLERRAQPLDARVHGVAPTRSTRNSSASR